MKILSLCFLSLSILSCAATTQNSANDSKWETEARKTFTSQWEGLLADIPQDRNPAGLLDNLFPKKEAKAFSDQDQLEISSSSKLELGSAKILIDNDDSFREKINAIQSARSGETIRIAYYIFTPDHSSAVFYSELIQAAKRGVKIKILADLLTNYQHLDLFHYLVREGNKNIQVKFYGRPTNLLIRDLQFLSLPCPKAENNPSPTFCSDAKWNTLKAPYSLDFFGKTLLAGILAKSPTAIKTGVLMGQELDLEIFQSGAGGATEEEKTQLRDFLELVFRWKVFGETTSGIKAKLAMTLYGAKLNPIVNEVFGRFPINQPKDKSFEEWEHITDFLHHKILMVGNHRLQIGGRNIENSYHMKPNPLIHKYIFKDVDAQIEIKKGGETIARSFDELYQFSKMTISLSDISRLAPNDFVASEESFSKIYDECAGKKPNRQKFYICFLEKSKNTNLFPKREARIAKISEQLENKKGKYLEYARQRRETETLPNEGIISAKDLAGATVTYLENLPYNKNLTIESRKRILGATVGKEFEEGKYIHLAWNRGLQNACVKAQSSPDPVRVILHSAYFLPPSGLIQDLTKMFDGTWNCNNVKVTILSNSYETTDLNVINLFGQYQMTAFFYVYSHADSLFPQSKNKRASFEYLEYKKMSNTHAISLHKKLHLMGDDLFVGSANGDVRSYYMDSNNGLYFKNVPAFSKSYVSWIESLRNDGDLKNRTKDFTGPGKNVGNMLADLHKFDVNKIEDFLSKRGWQNKIDSELKERIYDRSKSLGIYVYETTRKIMSIRFIDGKDDQQKRAKQNTLENEYNRLMQLL
jgi:putative cardiolipin synthase